MRTRTKVWLLVATALVLLGGILFAGVMTKLDWDFMKLSTVKYETNIYEISEAFDGISISTDTADIVFEPSVDGKCTLACYEDENAKHSVAVENNVLVVKINNQKTWHDYIGFCFGSEKITVYLPKAEYASLLIQNNTGDIEIPNAFTFKDADISLSTGDVHFCASASENIKIKTSTGDICADKISAGSLELKVSTGKVIASDITCAGDITVGVSTGTAYLTDISCNSVISSGSTGDIKLKKVVATELLSIERSTGDVNLESCDADEMYFKTNTGDVTGSLLTDKVFITQTDTGNVDVPKTVDGGRCEIVTDTGDIKLTIKQ